MAVTNAALRVLSEEVAAAIAARGPMVALETTVITHGLPSLASVETAMVLEDEVRRACRGIRVFATGGIGGVHRGDAGDVSADLTALSRLPIAVVSAGAKAVLDLPRTVEMLETLGVPVLGLGTDEFPAFYRRSSGLSVDIAVFDSV